MAIEAAPSQTGDPLPRSRGERNYEQNTGRGLRRDCYLLG
jgi:hypothetical protein